MLVSNRRPWGGVCISLDQVAVKNVSRWAKIVKIVTTHINQECRGVSQAAIDAVQHCPAQTPSSGGRCRSESFNSDAPSIVHTPSKNTNAGERADNRLGL
jgi:hypothetical protein